MRFNKKCIRFVFFALIVIILFLGFRVKTLQAERFPSKKFPLIANHYLRWDLDQTQAYELSRYDLIVLDMEVQVSTPRKIDYIRSLNPDIKILAYVTSQEIIDWVETLSNKQLRKKLFQEIPDVWYLKDGQDNDVSIWPNTKMLNVSDHAPIINNHRWNTYLPQFMHEQVMSSGKWDGIFYDNMWDEVSFVNQGKIDLDRNGVNEYNTQQLNDDWLRGLKTLLKTSRALEGPDAIILVNGGNSFQREANGRMFETFPRPEDGGWPGAISNYEIHLEQSFSPQISIINVNTENIGDRRNFQKMRFGLTSALLGDGFYSFDDGDQGHSVNWWYDEYQIKLGSPTNEPYAYFDRAQSTFRPGVWRRDFQRGIVIVNSTDHLQEIPLEEEFETFRGTQEVTINTGDAIDRLFLEPMDGRVLLRPLHFLDDIGLENSHQTEVFSLAGERVRNSFRAIEPRFARKAIIVRTDINGNGWNESVVAEKNKIRIYDRYGKLRFAFFPYGKSLRAEVQIAVGDLDGDHRKEIVTSTGKGGGPHIRIFNQRGELIHSGFFAYGNDQRGGVNIGLADVTGNGNLEILAGAGAGAAPFVRIFTKAGSVLHPGFRVYDPRFRGGVSVAGGRLRDSLKDEIVVGPSAGGSAHIRIFKGDGTLLSPGFFAFDPTIRTGVHVQAKDVNDDGVAEIIVQNL